ncbi:MAG: hypothetical protein FWC95_01435 [Defluviitaleaceae bacterium]|nr:hypothetical protein [Defluviitaleaceae bacterium]
MKNLMEIKSFDGYGIKGKLAMPDGTSAVPKLVLYIHGSGAYTYDRQFRLPADTRIPVDNEHNSFDFLADYLTDRGIAFFSYSTRGVSTSTNLPLFVDINEDEYKQYLPLNSVDDVYYMIKSLKENGRLMNSKVYLCGWSEGAIIAPMAAEKYSDMVDGLFLVGYPNENMKDTVVWQNTGGPSMVFYKYHFDRDADGRVSRAEYDADPNGVVPTLLQNTSFDAIDINNDGYIDAIDFALIWKDVVGYSLDDLFSAVDRGDDGWLRSHFGVVGGVCAVPLTTAWLAQHFSLKSNYEILPTLNLPILIFHGALDQNCDPDGVRRVQARFNELNKANLKVNIFNNHAHDLNYIDIILKNTISEGMQALFDAIEGI